MVDVLVGVCVEVRDGVGVAVGVCVEVGDGVGVAVDVAVNVGAGVRVGVCVGVGVSVGPGVVVGERVIVGVAVVVGVWAGVGGKPMQSSQARPGCTTSERTRSRLWGTPDSRLSGALAFTMGAKRQRSRGGVPCATAGDATDAVHSSPIAVANNSARAALRERRCQLHALRNVGSII